VAVREKAVNACRRGTEPLPLDQRQRVARDCLNGQNARRSGYAKEILAGDLFCLGGTARSYWHLLATKAPEPLQGRRGQWNATEVDGAWMWSWQDWGPA
jgi:hypothetical protein